MITAPGEVRLTVASEEGARAEVRRSYDAVAAAYAVRLGSELAHKPFDCAVLRDLAARVGRRGEIGDVGCGPGHVTAFLAAQGADVVGLDLSPAMIAEGELTTLHAPCPRETAPGAPNTALRHQSVRRLRTAPAAGSLQSCRGCPSGWRYDLRPQARLAARGNG